MTTGMGAHLHPSSDCPQVPSRRVSTATRISLACAGLLAAWQLAWLAEQADRLAAVIPPPWTVTFWIAAWTLVLATSAAAAITGHDRCTRAAYDADGNVTSVEQLTGLPIPVEPEPDPVEVLQAQVQAQQETIDALLDALGGSDG